MGQSVFGAMNGSQLQQQQQQPHMQASQNAFMHHHQFSAQPSQVSSWVKAPTVIENTGYNPIGKFFLFFSEQRSLTIVSWEIDN